MSGTLRFDSPTNIVVVHADGTEEPLQALITRATADIGATMDQLQPMQNQGQAGNLRLSFSQAYFPRRGTISGPERSVLNYKKAAAQCAIYSALIEAGVDAGQVTFSTGYMRNGQFVNSAQLFLNRSTIAPGTQAQQQETIDTLVEKVIAHGIDPDVVMEKLEKYAEREAIIRGWLKAQLASTEVKQAVSSSIPDDEPEGDEPPQTDEA